MKLSRRSTVLACFVLAAPSLLARATPAQAAPAELPPAREVIDRFVKATGAREVLERTKSVHMKGGFEMSAMGLKGPAEIWSAKPDLRYVSVDMGQFGAMVQGFDGKTAWMKHPMLGANLLKGTDLLSARLEADYDSILKSDDQYESLKTVARESFEGRDCYKVELVARPLAGMDAAGTLKARTSYEYYDVESGLLAGGTGFQSGELYSGPFTTIASDYKDFGGQRMATKTRLRQGGVEIVMTVDSVEFDTASEATFALPPDVKVLVEPPAPAPAK